MSDQSSAVQDRILISACLSRANCIYFAGENICLNLFLRLTSEDDDFENLNVLNNAATPSINTSNNQNLSISFRRNSGSPSLSSEISDNNWIPPLHSDLTPRIPYAPELSSMNSSSAGASITASAQIVLTCSANESHISLPFEKRSSSASAHPVDANSLQQTDFVPGIGHVVWRSPRWCLSNEAPLFPWQPLLASLDEPLPTHAPPSFRGNLVRFTYRLLLEVQALPFGAHASEQIPVLHTRLFFFVFHLVSFPELPDILRIHSPRLFNGAASVNSSSFNEEQNASGGSNSSPEENPFLTADADSYNASLPSSEHVHSRNEGSDESRALAVDSLFDRFLSATASARVHHQYAISTPNGLVCRLHLFKECFRVGDTIAALLDFSEATVPTYRYRLLLQSEELVASELLRPQKRVAAAADVDADADASGYRVASVTVHAHVDSSGLCVSASPAQLQIPALAFPEWLPPAAREAAPDSDANSDSASFSSCDFLRVRWRLRLELHLVARAASPAASDELSLASRSLYQLRASLNASPRPELSNASDERAATASPTKWLAPHALRTDTCVWHVPIRVLPAPRQLVPASSQLRPSIESILSLDSHAVH